MRRFNAAEVKGLDNKLNLFGERPQEIPAANVLGVEGKAPIVRPGETFDLKLRWHDEAEADYAKDHRADRGNFLLDARAVKKGSKSIQRTVPVLLPPSRC